MVPKKLIKDLKSLGFVECGYNGSHLKMKKGNTSVEIPVHHIDLKKGTLNQILKRAGLK